jgi:hypothetical protein
LKYNNNKKNTILKKPKRNERGREIFQSKVVNANKKNMRKSLILLNSPFYKYNLILNIGILKIKK